MILRKGVDVKAIIIAAGRGKRMKRLTDDIPKCLLDFNGRKLLDIQLAALRHNGIEDISIVVGYKKEKIKYPELKYYVNDRYEHNNILHSLLYAENEMNDGFIASYSDIIYDKTVIRKLCESKADISIVVDTDWRGYYDGRVGHPVEEAENVVFDPEGRVLNIGKILPDKDAAHGEFLGIFKCTKKGALIFKEHFNSLKEKFAGKTFQRAKVFEEAYVTDMVQDLVDSGIPVHCVKIEGGWKEIDTIDDYEKAVIDLSKEEQKAQFA